MIYRSVAVFLALCLSLGGALAWEDHFNARMGMIEFHANSAGKGSVLLVGDSNTEAFWWNSVGGCRVVNAGLGGAQMRDVAIRADTIAAATLPKVVHVMLGTNNVGNNYLSVEDDLTRIVFAFWNKGAVVVLWPVPPFATGWAGPDGERRREIVNESIKRVALTYGVFWDWWWPRQLGSSSVIGDGVHFSAATQSSRLTRLNEWSAYLKSINVEIC